VELELCIGFAIIHLLTIRGSCFQSSKITLIILTGNLDPSVIMLRLSQLTIDTGNPFRPLATVMVLHFQDILEWPVQVIGYVSYLLV
jgi:hypothetical protein